MIQGPKFDHLWREQPPIWHDIPFARRESPTGSDTMGGRAHTFVGRATWSPSLCESGQRDALVQWV